MMMLLWVHDEVGHGEDVRRVSVNGDLFSSDIWSNLLGEVLGFISKRHKAVCLIKGRKSSGELT